VPLKVLYHVVEIEDIPHEAVEAIDHHHVKLSTFTVLEKPLDCWPVQVFGAVAVVDVHLDDFPAL
jgi:hypothetical protein